MSYTTQPTAIQRKTSQFSLHHWPEFHTGERFFYGHKGNDQQLCRLKFLHASTNHSKALK